MKKVIALILAALMVLGLAACAAKTTTTEQDTDTPAQTAPADKAAEETTAADAADKQITVGFCPMDLSNNFFANIANSLRNAADAANVKAIISDGKSDAATQIAALENFISQGVDVIIVVPVDAESLKGVIAEAKSAGIPVITHTTEYADATCNMNVAELEMGQANGSACGKWMAETFGADADCKYAILTQRSLEQTIGRENGIMQGIAEYCPNAECVMTVDGYTTDMGMTAAENILTAHPEVVAILGINDSGALGAYETCVAQGVDTDKFYIGGNDSMDTIAKLSRYGAQVGSAVRFIGVPKTIDNDLCLTDHTPGYGSAAKYIGVVMKEIIRDATVYGTKYVTVVEIMGRNAGWLTAAAALAKSDDCEGVDMICLPEVPFNVEHFIEKVRVMQEKKPSIVIAVSEGVKLEDGRYVCELADDVHAVDAFGHKALTGTARYLANVVARNLDTKTRCIELSTLQRCAGHLTSRTDITEAYQVGGAAVKAAFEGVTGQMVALKRISNSPYQCTTELHPISEVANLEKKVPLSWMNENHTQMTEDFLAYARPLIQAELTPLYIAGLPHHIYMKPQK